MQVALGFFVVVVVVVSILLNSLSIFIMSNLKSNYKVLRSAHNIDMYKENEQEILGYQVGFRSWPQAQMING
jgi:hypothetical protein